MELWAAVPETNEKIFISSKGKIVSVLSGKPYELKTQTDNKGYKRIRITIDGNKRSYRIHRLVAQAFLDNPRNLEQVNHIDGDKENNCIENLEWITNQENARHAIKNGLWKSVFEGAKKENNSRKKKIIATKEKEKILFDSVSEAERFFDSRHIVDVCKGKRSHVKGWSFSYVKGGDLNDP